MLSKRLKTIAEMVKTPSVIDVGCDHGLLDIYLAKEYHKTCLACDISEKALQQAEKNVVKYQVQDLVKTKCTDGLTGIVVKKEDTVVLSGMGTHTIIKILEGRSDIERCIVSSHKDVPLLRRWMTKAGYQITEETYVIEKNILYVILAFERNEVQYEEIDYEVGPFLKKDPTYVNRLLEKEETLLEKVTDLKRKEEIQKKIEQFKKQEQ